MRGLLFSTAAFRLTVFTCSFAVSGILIWAGRSHWGHFVIDNEMDGVLQSAPNQPSSHYKRH